MQHTYIYTLSDSKGVRYIGKSNNPESRLPNHIKISKKKKSRKDKWIYSLLKKNEKPILENLEIVPKSEWEFHEKCWIEQFRCWGFDLVNGTIGGEGSNGFQGKKHSKETIEKCRSAGKMVKNRTYMFGCKNHMSKFIVNQVLEIRELLKKNIGIRKIAKMYGVSHACISRINTAKTYKNI